MRTIAMSEIKYNASNESITVVYEGKPYTVKEGAPNFASLRKALTEKDWDKVPGFLTVRSAIKNWSNDKFTVSENEVLYQGNPVPGGFGKRILETITDGKAPTPFYLFWERLQKNPSKRSVDQLWSFLEHQGIPLTTDGCFLAYKGVCDDFKDAHSGTIDNHPGNVIEIPRNSVSDDPREACHFGLHVGAKRYAGNFSSKLLIVKVDPEHVVCVPYDSSQQKMRVCKYEVIGLEGCKLPSTVFDDADRPSPEPEPQEAAQEEEETSFEDENPVDDTEAEKRKSLWSRLRRTSWKRPKSTRS
jgi:hypothetical protein